MEVGAKEIDADLPLPVVADVEPVRSERFEGVNRAEADGCAVVGELFDGFGVSVVQAGDPS